MDRKNYDFPDTGVENKNFYELKLFLSELETKTGINIGPEIENRSSELEKFTKHNKDARVITQAAGEAYHLIRKHDWYPVEPEDGYVLKMAAALHDIGKSGPWGLDFDQRQLVIKLYGIEKMSPKKTIGEVLADFEENGYLPVKRQLVIEQLKGLGLGLNDKMEKFWSKHADWGHQILRHSLSGHHQLIERVIKVAASHHYLEKINPAKVSLKSFEEISEDSFQGLGETEKEQRRDGFLTKLLIVFDQYQGARRRGQLKPERAFDYVRGKALKNGFEKDAEFKLILEKLLPFLEKMGLFLTDEERKG